MDSANSPAEETGKPDEAAEAAPKIKATRRQPCPCGSGKKFKNCCLGDPAYELVSEPQAASPAALANQAKLPPAQKHFPKQNTKASQFGRPSNATHRRRV